MEVKFINPFVAAVQAVYKTMLGLEVTMGKPVLKDGRTTSGDVSGIMGLVGDRKGTVAVSLTDKGAIFVLQTLLGDTAESITPEVVDAVGELTNIISGQARKEFEKNGLNLKASIPTVVVGHHVEINFITQVPTVSLPFSFPTGNGSSEIMYLDFSFE
jgi:chemotaxis protein CheX